MRDERLDFYKGFLIWSVVLGHCLNVCCPREDTLHLLLRTFDLPMFMYISGFLLRGSIRRYRGKQLICNKVTGVIFPALVWAVVSLLFGNRCFYYFLWAVFFSVTIVCVCEQHLGKSWAWAGMVLMVVGLHLVPYNVVNLSFLFPFFLTGYYSKNIAEIGWSKGAASIIVYIVLFLFLWRPEYTIWNSGGYLLWHTSYIIQVIVLRFAIGIVGIYSAILIWSRLYVVIKDSLFTRMMSVIGKETLGIYLLQHIIVEILLLRLVMKLGLWSVQDGNQAVVGYLLTPILSLLLLSVMYIIVRWLKQYNQTKWIFGFRYTL